MTTPPDGAGGWRIAYGTAVGTSHAAAGAPCQDRAACVTENGVLLAAVADGAGSAARAEEGAAIAVGSVMAAMASHAARDPALAGVDEDTVAAWLDGAKGAIAAAAAVAGAEPRDFACTLLAAAVGPERSAFAQVGDGAIAIRPEGAEGLGWVFWPRHGEHQNETCFLTGDEDAYVFAFDRPVHELAMFSDGLERLILDMGAKRLHDPALRPILRWLEGTDPAPERPGPSPEIEAFLASARINERTDDDKALVLAARPPAAQAP